MVSRGRGSTSREENAPPGGRRPARSPAAPKAAPEAAGTLELARVLRLLSRGGSEEVAAAAIVLGALRPEEPRVLGALCRALGRVKPALKPYVIDALGRLGKPEADARIAPHLLGSGALRDQAVSILSSRGEAVVPVLRRLLATGDGSCPSSVVAVAVATGTDAGFELVIELLGDADFDRARTIFSAIGHRHQAFPARARRSLARRLAAFLDAEPANATAEIAALKILGLLGLGTGVRPAVDRLGPGHRAAVRQAAVEALGRMEIAAARAGAVARRVRPLIAETESPRLATAAFRLLVKLPEGGLAEEELLGLAKSPLAPLAQAALRELRAHDSEAVVDALLDAFQDPDPGHRAAAARSLAALPRAAEKLLVLHEDAAFAERRDEVRAVLESCSAGTDGRRFARLARPVLSPEMSGPERGSRLLALAALDRVRLNRLVESEARRAVQTGRAADAIGWLEPLVRGRLASPAGRYLLSIAHLQAAGADAAPGHPDHDRAMQLLAPLSRLPEFDLGAALARERRIDPSLLRLVMEWMKGRSPPEQEVAARLARRLGLVG